MSKTLIRHDTRTREERNDDVFHAWECISLVKSYGTTFDLVIRDPSIMMVFIHFLHQHIYKDFD